MIQLDFLGGVSVTVDGEPVTGRAIQPRRVAVLAVLAASPRCSTTRDRLVALLWPETSARKGRKLLATSLYEIRQALGADAVVASGEQVALGPDRVRCDVARFRTSAREDPAEAVDLYDGPFLDGFHVRGSHEFDEWLEGEREELSRLYAGALRAAAGERERAGDGAAAIQLRRQLARHDPADARAARGLMEALVAAGDRMGALEHARRYAAEMEERFGLVPDPDILAYADSIREEGVAAREADLAAVGVGEASEEVEVEASDEPKEARQSSPADRIGALTAPRETSGSPHRPSGAASNGRGLRSAAPSRSRWTIWTGLGMAAAVVTWIAAGSGPPATPERPFRTQPVTSFEGVEEMPALSPDGRRVAFIWDGGVEGEADLYVMPADGAEPLRLTETPALDAYPTWSPDGQRIAFLRSPADGTEQIRVIPALGGAESLVAEGRLARGLDWSPRGDWLAAADTGGIVLVDPAVGDRRRVTTPPTTHYDENPVFSADGARVAFFRMENNTGLGAIHTISLSGGPRRQLTGLGALWDVDWTPDGSEILFTEGRPGYQSLMSVPAQGSDATEVWPEEGLETFSVAREAGVAVFTRRISDHDIWKLPGPAATEGARAEPLIDFTREESWAAYSPDGSRIAYNSNRSGSREIWVAPADGTSPHRRVTDVGNAMHPMWSPDGEKIAFHVPAPSPTRGTHVVDPEGGSPRWVVEGGVAPSWSRDGRWICVQYKGGADTWGIWRVPAEGGDPEPVLGGLALTPREGPDGRIYFERGRRNLHAVRLGEARSERVAEVGDVFWGDWWMWEGRLVYADWGDGPGNPAIWMLEPATGERRLVTSLAGRRRHSGWWTGLSVSPDGKWILYTFEDRSGADLVQAEIFR